MGRGLNWTTYIVEIIFDSLDTVNDIEQPITILLHCKRNTSECTNFTISLSLNLLILLFKQLTINQKSIYITFYIFICISITNSKTCSQISNQIISSKTLSDIQDLYI